MKYQLLFNGKHIEWNGRSFIASQTGDHQGPLPEGYYRLLMAQHDAADSHYPPLTEVSGKARFEPADIETKARCRPLSRDQFFVHDDGSHRCSSGLEVDSLFFSDLQAHRQKTGIDRLTLKIEYQ